MANFCLQIVLWGSFDRFLSISKKNKILEKIMIFVYQHGAWVLVVSAKSIKDYQKSSFFMIHLIFYDHHRSTRTLLFYSKHKVWIFPDILSPFSALYDKNSLLWFLANFSKKWDFSNSSKIHEILPKSHFFEKFARNHRSEFLSHRAAKGLKISGKIHTLCFE